MVLWGELECQHPLQAPCQGVLWERGRVRGTGLWEFRNSREKDMAVRGSGEGKQEYGHGSDPQAFDGSVLTSVYSLAERQPI